MKIPFFNDQDSLEIIHHLDRDLQHLNELWDTTRELNQLLNQRGATLNDRVYQLLDHVQEKSLSQKPFRDALIQRISDVTGKPLNLSRLLKCTKSEYRTQIVQLCDQIYDKLGQVQSMMYSNQIVLGYTANFYSQWLQRIAGISNPTDDFAGDRVASGSLVTRSC